MTHRHRPRSTGKAHRRVLERVGRVEPDPVVDVDGVPDPWACPRPDKLHQAERVARAAAESMGRRHVGQRFHAYPCPCGAGFVVGHRP